MNEWEKNYAKELLSSLDESDLFELARTVTKAKFEPRTRQEGIELILRYESDVRSLLSRKKISSKILIQYLHAKGVQFNIDGSKLSFCDLIQHLWNSSIPLPAIASTAVPATEPTTALTTVPSTVPTTVSVGLSDSDILTLGRQFVDWFFSQLRSPELELLGVGPQHFFSDASCRVHIGDDIQEGQGGVICASVLTESLRHIGGAVPIPNVNEVRSEASPHGAIKVLACGTLHAPQSRMLGAFEQAFLLVRDPTTPDNWKIKYTELRLKVQTQPKLNSSSNISIQY